VNPLFKSKWLEDLRSDKHVQGEGQLRTLDNRFCCLGVLCDLYNPDGWEENLEEWSYGEGPDYCHEIGVLPHDFRVDMGIDGDAQDHLIRMNDAGKSFAEIADWIEANL